MEWFDWLVSYDVLRVIWWALLGVLLIGFAVMDGFDLGVGALLPFIARTDIERRVLINSIGPTWEGNQVWLILGGGAIFAAFPALYAAAFSGFYFAMLILLLALILRPVGFDFRNKLTSARWRAVWDGALFIGGAVPALLFGVAVGNLFLGMPFHFDADLRFFYDGNFWLLLRPFALLCGLVSLAMLVTQGAAFINLKVAGPVQQRAYRLLPLAALATLLLFALAGAWIAIGVDGYSVVSERLAGSLSNPLRKAVEMRSGGWLDNYVRYPLFALAPLLAVVAMVAVTLLRRHPASAFIASSLTVVGVILTAGFSLFPFLFTSNSEPAQSLTVWDASSSQSTLKIMLLAVVIFMPLIIVYTSWVFRVLRGRIDADQVSDSTHSMY